MVGAGAVPPRDEIFDVTFHPLMRDRLVDWLDANGWTLVDVPGTGAGDKIPSFIVMMDSPAHVHEHDSGMCAICGTPLVHEKCPICAVPHGFAPYDTGSPYRWCKVCGLDEGDARAHHEAATA